MKIEDYNNLQGFENKTQIAVDFDGVIHRNSKGFHDGTIYDTPIDGSLDAIKELHDTGYTIVIFTAKAKKDRPLVNGKTGEELIWEWLDKYGISQYVKEVTSEKPRAKYYIDDNGIRFTNWNDTLDLVLSK